MIFLFYSTDDEVPEITGKPDEIIRNNDPNLPTAIVTWTPPTATDNSGVVSLTSSQNPGTPFPIGRTEVQYAATDPSQNMAFLSFTVVVLGRFTYVETFLFKDTLFTVVFDA